MPQTAPTYTATFKRQYYLTTVAGPGGNISPPSGWYDSGTQLSVLAQPNSRNWFTGFSGDLAGTSLPQSLVMSAAKSVTANFAAATQVRTFEWSGTDLVSATNPENGTVSYAYDGSHRVTSRTDAKGQRTEYTYDAYGRLTQVRHYAGSPYEDPYQHWDYYYDANPLDGGFSQNTWGRMAAVEFGVGGTSDKARYMYSYNQAGRVTGQRMYVGMGGSQPIDLVATYEWDTEGRMTSLTYPGSPAQPVHYQYDAMGRLQQMTQDYGFSPVTAAYGPAGEITSMTYAGNTETRTYNPMGQLTGIRVTHYDCTPSCLDLQYAYPAGQNNGRISSMTDGLSGEQVTYQYDSLNRLMAAAGSGWSQVYQYDGFGNMTNHAGRETLYDPATNRETLANYDANGNWLGYIVNMAQGYDVENRLTGIPSVQEGYGYDPWGKRIVKRHNIYVTGSPQEYYFYGITGQKLATVTCTDDQQTGFSCGITGTNVYFGGKLISENGVTVTPDRLGSVRRNGTGYYPYGEERVPTPEGRTKFATYYRDAVGQDYADQRYYNAAKGRFSTPDPGGIQTANPRNPGSWNRYAYVNGDPVNFNDPSGQTMAALQFCVGAVTTWDDLDCMEGSFSQTGNWGGGWGGFNPCNRSQWLPNPLCPVMPIVALPPPSGPPKPRAYFLQVRPNSDCYHVPLNVKDDVTRDISYDLYYLDETMSTPMHTSQGTIWEHLVGLGSSAGSDSPSSGPPGTYDDQQSIAGFGTDTQIGTQTFTVQFSTGVTVGLAIAAFGGTVSDPIASLHIEKYAGYISINGDIGGRLDSNGHLIPGSYKPCGGK
jgi:RHS repeat-associated protein